MSDIICGCGALVTASHGHPIKRYDVVRRFDEAMDGLGALDDEDGEDDQ